MTSNNQEKLDDLYEMTQENNDMLKSIVRRQRISSFFTIVYWTLVIGSLLGVYYYARPHIEDLYNQYSNFKNTFNVNTPDSVMIKVLQDFLKK